MTERAVILANPTAGGGRAVVRAAAVARTLAANDIPVTLATPQDAETLSTMAAKAADAGAAAILASGGDGTVHRAIQGIVGSQVPFGIIPAGSGNDAARTLGVDRLPIERLGRAFAEAIATGQTSNIDVGKATLDSGPVRFYLAVLSSGFDSTVNERANRMTWPPGQAKYITAMLAELAPFRPVPYRVTIDGVVQDGRGMLVSVGNGTSFGGGMRVCPDASIEDGMLDLTWLHEVGKGEFLRVFPRVYQGTHVTHPKVETRQARTLRIEAPGQVAYADGERLGPLPVTVESVPSGLRTLQVTTP